MKNEFRPDYIMIPYPVYSDQRLESADRILYGIIYWLEHMHERGMCTASNATLGRIAAISPRSVPNNLDNLEKFGYIERVFKDEKKRNRLEIKALVSFHGKRTIRSSMTRDTQLGDTRDTQLGEQSINNNIKKHIAAQAPQGAYKPEETRKKWYEGKDEAFQLLAFFFDRKGLWKKLDTREKVAHTAKRHLRAARRIISAGWSQQEVEKAISKMPQKLQDEWTLETIEKYLTK